MFLLSKLLFLNFICGQSAELKNSNDPQPWRHIYGKRCTLWAPYLETLPSSFYQMATKPFPWQPTARCGRKLQNRLWSEPAALWPIRIPPDSWPACSSFAVRHWRSSDILNLWQHHRHPAHAQKNSCSFYKTQSDAVMCHGSPKKTVVVIVVVVVDSDASWALWLPR